MTSQKSHPKKSKIEHNLKITLLFEYAFARWHYNHASSVENTCHWQCTCVRYNHAQRGKKVHRNCGQERRICRLQYWVVCDCGLFSATAPHHYTLRHLLLQSSLRRWWHCPKPTPNFTVLHNALFILCYNVLHMGGGWRGKRFIYYKMIPTPQWIGQNPRPWAWSVHNRT